MQRRKFIKLNTAALIAAPLVFSRNSPIFASSSPSHLVSVMDSFSTGLNSVVGQEPNHDGVIVDKILSYSVNRTRVANMVDTAVMKLSGQSSVGKAWESLFPSGNPSVNNKIGIKFNLSYGERFEENDWSRTYCPFGPKAALTDAVVMGLTQMLDGTFPIENITLFDSVYGYGRRLRNSITQGYRPVIADSDGLFKDSSPGNYRLHWVSPRNPLEISTSDPGFIAAPDFPEEYQAPQKFYAPISENDFMINVANAKTHREGGITGVMKNTFGCTNNPVGTHGTREWMSDDSPYPGSRNCAPAFYKALDKTTPCILNILDALAGIYYGGPLAGKVFKANSIAVSQDPVAIDTHLLNLVNEHRQLKGYVPITSEEGRNQDGFPNAPILKIASEIHGLGSMSMDGSQTYDLSNSQPEYDIPSLQKPQSRVGDVSANGSKFQVNLWMDDSQRSHLIESRIEDLKGTIIQEQKSQTTKSSKKTLLWNNKDSNKKLVGAGRHVWHVTVDGIEHSRIIEGT